MEFRIIETEEFQKQNNSEVNSRKDFIHFFGTTGNKDYFLRKFELQEDYILV